MMAATFASDVIDTIMASSSLDEFVPRAAHLISEINAGHPFREGNGRTQLAYLNLLAASVGLPFHADLLVPHRVMNAMIRSFLGDLGPLTELVTDLVS